MKYFAPPTELIAVATLSGIRDAYDRTWFMVETNDAVTTDCACGCPVWLMSAADRGIAADGCAGWRFGRCLKCRRINCSGPARPAARGFFARLAGRA